MTEHRSTMAPTDAANTFSDKAFRKISNFIYDNLGIKMPEAKKTMLQGRLMKRMRVLKIVSFDAYCDYLFCKDGRRHEIVHLLDAVTTNKTDFFREPKHFEFLSQKVLPELAQKGHFGARSPLSVWSAGCSTGAEPYTLAMVLSEFSQRRPDLDFLVIATDISTKVLEKAHQAVYTETEVRPVAPHLRKKYLLRSKDRTRKLVRIAPEIRNKVKFGRLNFMADTYEIPIDLDVVFCRNVLIYFDYPTQQKVLSRLCRHLRPGGYFFSGHSENLNGYELPLRQVATTVYRKH